MPPPSLKATTRALYRPLRFRRTASSTPHYDPPTGWLFGTPPGAVRQKEGWENLMIFGFFGSLLATAIAYAYKPDTSIQTWALEEARRRLEAEGILPDAETGKGGVLGDRELRTVSGK